MTNNGKLIRVAGVVLEAPRRAPELALGPAVFVNLD